MNDIPKITFSKKTRPMHINWNEFLIEIPEGFNGLCSIYVNHPSEDINEDIMKLEGIKRISGLERLIIRSEDYRIAEYFNTLLKGIDVNKEFTLMNDFEFKDRSYINFNKLDYDKVIVPLDYLMYGINTEGITQYSSGNNKEKENFGEEIGFEKNNFNLIEKIDQVIEEIVEGIPLEELDDIDKSILISNWIQDNIQYINGRVSKVKGDKYICDKFHGELLDIYDILSAIENKTVVCDAIAKLTLVLLTHPKINCKANMANASDHAYVIQNIDGKEYVVDNTWNITRNPNKMGESLKASEFSNQYLLVGQDKINENENTIENHTQKGIYRNCISEIGISRERIEKSVEKLKGYGVEFSYSKPPKYVQYKQREEKDKSNIIPELE